jgi:hypothetical protein
MSNPYRDRLLSVGVLTAGRTGSRVREGREHPESGKPFKAVTDEHNNTVTEHSRPGTGVSFRQDVHIRPDVIAAEAP